LISGETGTGKELIARAVHNCSTRHSASFVKINFAAIPAALLESEIFGHERGAFTSALTRKLGRIELAHGGTLFLDEIGDLPLELQPKLLRVLQDREFERLGGNTTIRVDVRLIAATNRDMSELVGKHEFRSDLFYRLNVFPIHVPPLRSRKEDIPALVYHFAQRFSERMGRKVDTVSFDFMQALGEWSWPGNIRELENLIERSIILSNGKRLRMHGSLGSLHPHDCSNKRSEDSLAHASREHIIRVLRESLGVVSGPHGAAERLGLKRSTLQSKMKQLRIRLEDYR
jgi:formate hydrogenlyase transcriptional activator